MVVVLLLIHAYVESVYRLTVPADPEVGVTTSDDGGCW